MKAFRIKISSENGLNQTFKFLFLSKCLLIQSTFCNEDQETAILIKTKDTGNYTFVKKMNYIDHVLFESKLSRFKQSDEIFFNLGEFKLKLD